MNCNHRTTVSLQNREIIERKTHIVEKRFVRFKIQQPPCFNRKLSTNKHPHCFFNPRFADAWFNRATYWKAKGHLVRAEADFTQAIEINPRAAYAYGQRGLMRLLQGRADEAQADFVRCLELDRACRITHEAIFSLCKPSSPLFSFSAPSASFSVASGERRCLVAPHPAGACSNSPPPRPCAQPLPASRCCVPGVLKICTCCS